MCQRVYVRVYVRARVCARVYVCVRVYVSPACLRVCVRVRTCAYGGERVREVGLPTPHMLPKFDFGY